MASVSVIVPASGQTAQLRQVLKDLEAQTVRPMEVIVICPAAHAPRLEHQLELANLQARVIGLPDSPTSAEAANVGVSSAHGDFVVLHDETSSWAPTVLEIATDWLQNHSAADAIAVAATGASAAPLVYRRTAHALLGYYHEPTADTGSTEFDWLRRLATRGPIYALPNTLTGQGQPRLLLQAEDETDATSPQTVTDRLRTYFDKIAFDAGDERANTAVRIAAVAVGVASIATIMLTRRRR